MKKVNAISDDARTVLASSVLNSVVTGLNDFDLSLGLLVGKTVALGLANGMTKKQMLQTVGESWDHLKAAVAGVP